MIALFIIAVFLFLALYHRNGCPFLATSPRANQFLRGFGGPFYYLVHRTWPAYRTGFTVRGNAQQRDYQTGEAYGQGTLSIIAIVAALYVGCVIGFGTVRYFRQVQVPLGAHNPGARGSTPYPGNLCTEPFPDPSYPY